MRVLTILGILLVSIKALAQDVPDSLASQDFRTYTILVEKPVYRTSVYGKTALTTTNGIFYKNQIEQIIPFLNQKSLVKKNQSPDIIITIKTAAPEVTHIDYEDLLKPIPRSTHGIINELGNFQYYVSYKQDIIIDVNSSKGISFQKKIINEGDSLFMYKFRAIIDQWGSIHLNTNPELFAQELRNYPLKYRFPDITRDALESYINRVVAKN